MKSLYQPEVVLALLDKAIVREQATYNREMDAWNDKYGHLEESDAKVKAIFEDYLEQRKRYQEAKAEAKPKMPQIPSGYRIDFMKVAEAFFSDCSERVTIFQTKACNMLEEDLQPKITRLMLWMLTRPRYENDKPTQCKIKHLKSLKQRCSMQQQTVELTDEELKLIGSVVL